MTKSGSTKTKHINNADHSYLRQYQSLSIHRRQETSEYKYSIKHIPGATFGGHSCLPLA